MARTLRAFFDFISRATRVAFTVDSSGLPIHRDATIRVRDRLFLEGGYYLELDPGSPSAPTLHDGDLIRIGTYLLTVTMINIGVGVATGIVCALTRMPNPVGLGALAATLNFIPIIGPVAMFLVLVVVGVIAFPTLGAGLMAAAAFCGIAFMEGHFITPAIIGRRLALNALAVFLALAFWTWLWGPMGAFLSSPLLIVALVLKEHLSPSDSPQFPAD